MKLGAVGLPAEAPTGAKAGKVAVAGIAKPETFFRMLRDAGYEISETIAFADHHRYSRKDVARIAAAACPISFFTVALPRMACG